MTMHDVELVEPDDAPTAASASEPSLLDRVRRRPRWLAAGAAVVVGLVSFQVVSDRRVRAADDARAAALADVPYVLDPVDPAFPVLVQGSYSWEDGGVPPVVSAFVGGGAPVADVLVTGTSGSSRSREAHLVAIDPATAEVVWDTAFAAPVEGATDAGGWCWAPEVPDAATARCVVRWQLPTADDSGLWQDLAAVVEVDASDGDVVRRTDLPVGATLGTGAWGMVVGTLDGSRLTLDASRWDGSHLWTRTLEMPRRTADDQTFLNLMVVEERLLVSDSMGGAGWVLSTTDGTLLRTLDDGTGSGMTRLLSTGAVVVDDPELASDEPRGDVPAMLVRPDGSEVPFDGDHVEWVGLDDGTLGDALLTGTAAAPGYARTRGGTAVPSAEADGSVARLRGPDGTVRWEVPGLDVLVAIAVDGLVVARTSDEVAAVDARTGRVRWRVATSGDGSSINGLLTDGRVILVADGTQLDALSYRGERLWSVHVRDAGDEHVVAPGPAPTPAPTGAEGLTGDQVQWIASPSGRLALGVMTGDGDRQEYLVFGR
ncbi:PQQ-binding-like beta-propeller repeat protein [Cellulomonas septica]|uniref:PQQ-binding-like beta-propeller repeat protein n=2 Tax=Cellulomonas septica TaxID=285080 RepID=A0ABX1K013_9CELL|nr:PQQ-binding-like beta-propeller repeat protein [Cellulomonas septica]